MAWLGADRSFVALGRRSLSFVQKINADEKKIVWQ